MESLIFSNSIYWELKPQEESVTTLACLRMEALQLSDALIACFINVEFW